VGAALEIGGAPVVTLRAPELPSDAPGFVEAEVLPGRGMMLLQAKLRLPSGEVVDAIEAPSAAEAARRLGGGPDDFAGNASFSFGGAILAPYANRIRGRPLPDSREIEADIAGQSVRLPRNWGGKAAGAEQYAMHGLILEAHTACRQDDPSHASGWLDAGDFGGRWPGRLRLGFEWRLAGGVLILRVRAQNVGDQPAPVGIGWHPYFRLPSGRRDQARLFVSAAGRVLVNDYDEVLPTGALEPVTGTAYDFSAAAGRALGEQYLDDCFTDLRRSEGRAVAQIIDPAAGLGLTVASSAAKVRAFQVYAPPDKAFVALEPQFNLADPFGPEWKGRDTGMVMVPPGGAAAYDAEVTAFALGNP
jgi:galactose mutarotase-like enzyme